MKDEAFVPDADSEKKESPRKPTTIDGCSTIGSSSSRAGRIRGRLQGNLHPVELEIVDVSHEHAGHAGVRGNEGGETHFNVKIVSDGFRGMNLVKRHRLVYDLLREELQSGLHALSIIAKTPSESGFK